MRLVADQEPEDVFATLKAVGPEVAPPGVEVTVRLLGTGRPSQTPLDHPHIGAASRALERVFGQSPLYINSGGSIPVAASFQRILGLPVVLPASPPPNARAQAPNGWFALHNYEAAIRTMAATFDEIASLDKG